VTGPQEGAAAELFIGYINEMQRLLGDVWMYLRDHPSPEAQALVRRIENLDQDGGELHRAIGDD
jgi:hypothetical protein